MCMGGIRVWACELQSCCAAWTAIAAVKGQLLLRRRGSALEHEKGTTGFASLLLWKHGTHRFLSPRTALRLPYLLRVSLPVCVLAYSADRCPRHAR